jgi:predicted enzyme related to lactoylglutathione lyase
MPNAFAHIELTTKNLKDAKKFYSKLFDWKLTDMQTGGGPAYTMIAAGKQPGGGMQAQPMKSAPIAWLPYVEVDSVDASLAKVVKLGGKVMLPTMDIGSNGVIGVFTDPAGAMLGIWSKAKGKPARKKAAKKAAKKR